MAPVDPLSSGAAVSIRLIHPDDFAQLAPHEYSISVAEPLGDMAQIKSMYDRTGFWQAEFGAVAITLNAGGRLVGTCQYFRSGPCIHGLEIGYIIHAEQDRGNGFASQGLRLLSDYLFQHRDQYHRHQLTIAVDNLASCKVAEKGGFTHEGLLRSSGFGESPADCHIYGRVRQDLNPDASQ